MKSLAAALAEAHLFRDQARNGASQGEIATAAGVRRPLVNKRLALLDVDAEAAALLQSAGLGVAHLYALCRLSTATSQRELARLAVRRGWSLRELERAITRERGEHRPLTRHWPGAHPDAAALAQLLEDQIAEATGLPFSVRALRGNRLEFRYLADDIESAWALAAHFDVGPDTTEL